MQKTNGGNPEAEFPPRIRGLGLASKIRGARGTAEINVNNLGGGVQGWCPSHSILDCEGPGLVGRLLYLVRGDWQGLILRQGVGSSIGLGLQGRELRKTLEHRQIKALRAVRQRNSGKWGKFVRNWYKIRTNFVQILSTFCGISFEIHSLGFV